MAIVVGHRDPIVRFEYEREPTNDREFQSTPVNQEQVHVDIIVSWCRCWSVVRKLLRSLANFCVPALYDRLCGCCSSRYAIHSP